MRGNPLHQSVSCGHPLQPGGRWPSPTPSPHRRRRPRPHVWIWTVLPAAATSSTSFDALAASPAAVRLARRWLSPPGGLVRVRAPSPSDGCDDAACQAAARPHPALLGEVQPAAVLDAARQRAVGSRPQATWWRGVRVGSADSVVSTAPPSPLVTTPMSATACPLSATTWGSPVSASRCCPLGSPASSTCVSEDVIFLCIESTAPTAAHAAGAHCREASPARVTSRLLQRGEYYQK